MTTPWSSPRNWRPSAKIADNQLTRIQQFLDSERNFDDAIVTDEFVLPVDVWPDGTISIEDGRVFGKID